MVLRHGMFRLKQIERLQRLRRFDHLVRAERPLRIRRRHDLTANGSRTTRAIATIEPNACARSCVCRLRTQAARVVADADRFGIVRVEIGPDRRKSRAETPHALRGACERRDRLVRTAPGTDQHRPARVGRDAASLRQGNITIPANGIFPSSFRNDVKRGFSNGNPPRRTVCAQSLAQTTVYERCPVSCNLSLGQQFRSNRPRPRLPCRGSGSRGGIAKSSVGARRPHGRSHPEIRNHSSRFDRVALGSGRKPAKRTKATAENNAVPVYSHAPDRFRFPRIASAITIAHARSPARP